MTTRDLIQMLSFQQFYLGKDTISSRTKDNSIKIKSSGLVIQQLNLVLYSPEQIAALESQQYEQFLLNVGSKIPQLDTRQIWNTFKEKADSMDLWEKGNKTVAITVLIGEIINTLRKKPFQQLKEELKTQILEKSKSPGAGTKKFEDLLELNHPSIAILENLSYLRYLAEIFHFKQVKRVVGIQIGKKINQLLENLE
jgi:hypothetical protein